MEQVVPKAEGPIPPCELGKVDCDVKLRLEDLKSDLTLKVNKAILSQVGNPIFELSIQGVTTVNAVAVDVHCYSYDAVKQVEAAFAKTGYFCAFLTHNGFQAPCSYLIVSWDKRLLVQYDDEAEELALSDAPVHPATLEPDFQIEGDIYLKAIRLAGLHGIEPTRWTKKRSLAFLSAVMVLAIELRKRLNGSHGKAVRVEFPVGVSPGAISSALSQFTWRPHYPEGTTPGGRQMEFYYVPSIEHVVKPEELAEVLTSVITGCSKNLPTGYAKVLSEIMEEFSGAR